MKLLTSITTIIAAASARQIYNPQHLENYANSAESYQSAAELQQQTLYTQQPQTFEVPEVSFHEKQSEEKLSPERTAKILGFNAQINGHGYQYSYETDNGIKAQEEGQTDEHGNTATQGTYSYKGDDGQIYTVQYIADENGYRAEGSHLPTPPPVPEAILKSLEENAKDEASGNYDDGHYNEESQQAYQQPQHQQYQPQEQFQDINTHRIPYQDIHLQRHQHQQIPYHLFQPQQIQQQNIQHELIQNQHLQLPKFQFQESQHQQQQLETVTHQGTDFDDQGSQISEHAHEEVTPIVVGTGADIAYRGHLSKD